MKEVESTINNMTSSTLSLQIKDFVKNNTAKVELKPKENFILKAYDQELEIKIAGINNRPEDIIFKTRLSSYMTISQDIRTNEFVIQDYVKNVICKAVTNNNEQPLLVSAGASSQYSIQGKTYETQTGTGNSWGSNTSSYLNNTPGNYVQSNVSYSSNSSSIPNSSNFPSSYSTSYNTYPTQSTGSYNFTNPTNSISQNVSKDYSIPKTTYNIQDSAGYSRASYNLNTTSVGLNSNSSNLSNSQNYSSVIGQYPSTTVNPQNYSSAMGQYSSTTINPQNYSSAMGQYSSTTVNPQNYSSSIGQYSSTTVNPQNYSSSMGQYSSTTVNPQNYSSAVGQYSSTTVKPINTNTSSYNPIENKSVTLNAVYNNTTINSNSSSTVVNDRLNNIQSNLSVKIDSNNYSSSSISGLKEPSTLMRKTNVPDTVKTRFKKYGSFEVDHDVFQVEHIKEEVVRNRLNLFNQLHRHNLSDEKKKAMDYAEVDQIKIKNKSSTPFYVRLSGGNGSEILEMLYEGESRTWKREIFCVYKVNITTAVALAGVTYNVKSGCRYIIDESNNLTDAGLNTIISTSTPYNPNFSMVNQFGAFFKKEDSTIHDAVKKDKSKLMIVNRSDDGVCVKVEGDGPSNFEDYIEIEPLTYVLYKRRENSSYVLTYNKEGTSITKKHKITAGNVYCFAEDYLGLCDDITKKSIDIFIPQVEVVQKDPLNVYWEKLKNLIKSNPNKNKINSFDALLFGKVLVKNQSKTEVFIRVKSRKIGSEEFSKISNFEEKSWKRFDGTYLAEIVTLQDMKSKRYLLKTNVNYSVNDKLEIIDSLNMPLEQERKECFDSKNLVFYDSEEKQYLRREILYDSDSEINTKNQVLKEIEKEKKTDAENEQRDFGYHDERPEEEEYEYFEGIKPDYIEGLPYEDPQFPPNQTSLEAVDPFTHKKRKPHFVHAANKELSKRTIEHIVFKRPSEAFKGQYYLFKDEICYDDVKQGQIGNCYLMSILAALSQRPDLIKAVFKTQTVNPDGYYELFFYEQGKKKVIFIDDHVVLEKGSSRSDFQFAKPNGEELWVMLIEKAYAKYEGGYSNILGGLMYPELKWLTGAFTRDVKVTNPQCWNEIYNACKARHILVTGSLTGSGNHNKKSLKGISNGHAYSIMDAKEYRFPGTDKSLRLLKMRNPWGHTEWSGDYCDNSPLWTPELKTFFEFEKGVKNDGLFFMPFDDYIKEFKNVVICAIDTRR